MGREAGIRNGLAGMSANASQATRPLLSILLVYRASEICGDVVKNSALCAFW